MIGNSLEELVVQRLEKSWSLFSVAAAQPGSQFPLHLEMVAQAFSGAGRGIHNRGKLNWVLGKAGVLTKLPPLVPLLKVPPPPDPELRSPKKTILLFNWHSAVTKQILTTKPHTYHFWMLDQTLAHSSTQKTVCSKSVVSSKIWVLANAGCMRCA